MLGKATHSLLDHGQCPGTGDSLTLWEWQGVDSYPSTPGPPSWEKQVEGLEYSCCIQGRGSGTLVHLRSLLVTRRALGCPSPFAATFCSNPLQQKQQQARGSDEGPQSCPSLACVHTSVCLYT